MGSTYPARRRRPPTVSASWHQQSWPLRILRGFLGVTFVYAGIQKLSDRHFLHRGTPDYIGSQLQAFERGSPIHPFLAFLGHFPALTGLGVALTETGIGLATLLGIGAVVAATGGMALSLTLFLSATWHVHPYFLGSDSVYAVAWGAYLAGLVEIGRRMRAAPPTGSRRRRAEAMQQGLGRREFLRGAMVGLGTLFLGVGATAFAGTQAATTETFGGPSPSLAPVRRRNRRGTAPPRASNVQGTPVAKLDQIPVGSAIPFDDPAQGPSVLVRLSQHRVVAYSRTCTHAGCAVGYDAGSGLLVCPCHGAEFDPTRGAEVVSGPAPFALANVPVAIDSATGTVVAKS
jgi:thiosulfate dehydrogenase [quinone] large subunit